LRRILLDYQSRCRERPVQECSSNRLRGHRLTGSPGSPRWLWLRRVLSSLFASFRNRGSALANVIKAFQAAQGLLRASHDHLQCADRSDRDRFDLRVRNAAEARWSGHRNIESRSSHEYRHPDDHRVEPGDAGVNDHRWGDEDAPRGAYRGGPLDSLPPGSTAEVVAVILEDGTGIGDEQIISAIFARRVKERDALRNVVQAFNDVLPSRQGTAALDALRNLFSDLVQRDDSIPCRAALDAVQTYSRSTNADQIDQSLKVYSAFVTREYELALKHSQRKLP
jgi:hypothetical protein